MRYSSVPYMNKHGIFNTEFCIYTAKIGKKFGRRFNKTTLQRPIFQFRFFVVFAGVALPFYLKFVSKFRWFMFGFISKTRYPNHLCHCVISTTNMSGYTCRLSPCKIPLLILTSPCTSPLLSSKVFHLVRVLLKNLLIWYSQYFHIDSKIQEYGTVSYQSSIYATVKLMSFTCCLTSLLCRCM